MADKAVEDEVVDVEKKYFNHLLDMAYDNFYGSLVIIKEGLDSRYGFMDMPEDIKWFYNQIKHILGLKMVPKKEIHDFVLGIDPIVFLSVIADQTWLGMTTIGMVVTQWLSLYKMLIKEKEIDKKE